MNDINQWFTDREIKLYFGARSPDELRQVCDTMRPMTTEQVARFKAELRKVTNMQRHINARLHPKHVSTKWGKLLLSLKSTKGDK